MDFFMNFNISNLRVNPKQYNHVTEQRYQLNFGNLKTVLPMNSLSLILSQVH